MDSVPPSGGCQLASGLLGGEDYASTGENKVMAELTAIINTRTGIKILFIV
jgi:hypothetical protein